MNVPQKITNVGRVDKEFHDFNATQSQTADHGVNDIDHVYKSLY